MYVKCLPTHTLKTRNCLDETKTHAVLLLDKQKRQDVTDLLTPLPHCLITAPYLKISTNNELCIKFVCMCVLRVTKSGLNKKRCLKRKRIQGTRQKKQKGQARRLAASWDSKNLQLPQAYPAWKTTTTPADPAWYTTTAMGLFWGNYSFNGSQKDSVL